MIFPSSLFKLGESRGFQALIWFCVFLFFAALGTRISIEFAILNSIHVVSGIMVVAYGNTLFFIPRFFMKERLRYYLFSFLFLAVLIAIYSYVDYEFFFPLVEHRKDAHIGFAVMRYMMTFLLVFFITTSVAASKKANRAYQQREIMLREKAELELKFLKSQINPHFLFNALNNVYSQVYMQEAAAADSVLRLSAMLRYVLDDCSAKWVEINKEVEYLRNFIDFQQLKSERPQQIQFDVDLANDKLPIAPMILIPFVENCFKHSRLENNPRGYVTLKLSAADGVIHFSAENSKPAMSPIHANNRKGIGLENVRKHLEIAYGSHFNLDVMDEQERFVVNLRLEVISEKTTR